MTPEEIKSIKSEVLESRKYSDLDSSLLDRIILEESKKFKKKKEVVKSVKGKLHQIYGAFFEKYDGSFISQKISEMGSLSGDIKKLQSVASEVLRRHSSTEERLFFFAELYKKIFAITGIPNKMLDLACGLNPFTYLFIEGFQNIEFHASDISDEVTELLNKYFQNANVNGVCKTVDLITSTPTDEYDVILLFKTLPVLDRQIKNGGKNTLQQLNGKFIVVSFPSKSLSGKEKGMRDNYTRYFEQVASELNYTYEQFEFDNEIFFVIKK